MHNSVLRLAMGFLFASTSSYKTWGQKSEFAEIKLIANKDTGLSAMDQIRKAFGKYSIESPDLFEGNHQDFVHIKIQKDPELYKI